MKNNVEAVPKVNVVILSVSEESRFFSIFKTGDPSD
jgi:hypothetical protein